MGPRFTRLQFHCGEFLKAIQADNEIAAGRAAFLCLPLALGRGQSPWVCLAGPAEPREGAQGQTQPHPAAQAGEISTAVLI